MSQLTSTTVPVPTLATEPPTALYRYFDEDDITLYVGISDHLPVREYSHVKSSVWMQLAVRSTIGRYPSRDEALAVERTAIETEHPIFNKQYNDTPEAVARLERYLAKRGMPDLLKINKLEVSIPIQEFRPKPPPGPPQRPTPTPTQDAEAGNRTRYRSDGVPCDWPRKLWCNVWQNATSFWPFADEMSLQCNGSTRLASVYYHMEVRQTHAEGPLLARAAESWVEPDNPKASSRAPRYAATWSAHCEIRPAPQVLRMRPEHQELQRQFLYGLLRARRCSVIQLGCHAWASGFYWKEEAQVAAVILAGMAWAETPRGTDARLAIAILRATSPERAAHECPQCKVRFVDYTDRRPLCLDCRLEMTALYDEYGWPILPGSPFW